MLKLLAVVTFVCLTSATTDMCQSTTTCIECGNQTATAHCKWFTDVASPLAGGGCYNETSISESTVMSARLTLLETCPNCQAGTCGRCQDQTGCAWFTNLATSKCASDDYVSDLFTKTDAGSCPKCDEVVNPTCESCWALEGCYWYDILGSLGECAEEVPTGKTVVPNGACGGSGCIASNCGACTGLNGTECSWYTSKVPLNNGDKCAYADMTGVQAPFYEEILAASCPVCSATSCSECHDLDEDCMWYDYLGLNGKCQAASEEKPTGMKEVTADRCSDVCELFSCTDCNEGNGCSWYVPKGSSSMLLDSVCSFTEKSPLIGADSAYDKPEECPACAATRCFECGEGEGCNWFETILGTNGECSDEASMSVKSIVDQDSEKCSGNPANSANTKSISGIFVAALVLAVVKLL